MNIDGLIKNLGYLHSALSNMPTSVVRDFNGINRAISDLRKQKQEKSKEIRVDVPNLLFNVRLNNHQHMNPKSTQFNQVKLNSTLIFKGKTLQIGSIKEMNVDIVLEGISNGIKVRNAWHFDFHATNGDEAYSHPMFHCQNGGRELRVSPNEASDYIKTGEIFLVESPRIAHPPLDPTLAVEFVFGHFLGNDDLRKLYNIREFNVALRSSIESVWRPYYESINKFFDEPQNITNNNTASKLNPSLRS